MRLTTNQPPVNASKVKKCLEYFWGLRAIQILKFIHVFHSIMIGYKKKSFSWKTLSVQTCRLHQDDDRKHKNEKMKNLKNEP